MRNIANLERIWDIRRRGGRGLKQRSGPDDPEPSSAGPAEQRVTGFSAKSTQQAAGKHPACSDGLAWMFSSEHSTICAVTPFLPHPVSLCLRLSPEPQPAPHCYRWISKAKGSILFSLPQSFPCHLEHLPLHSATGYDQTGIKGETWGFSD